MQRVTYAASSVVPATGCINPRSADRVANNRWSRSYNWFNMRIQLSISIDTVNRLSSGRRVISSDLTLSTASLFIIILVRCEIMVCIDGKTGIEIRINCKINWLRNWYLYFIIAFFNSSNLHRRYSPKKNHLGCSTSTNRSHTLFFERSVCLHEGVHVCTRIHVYSREAFRVVLQRGKFNCLDKPSWIDSFEAIRASGFFRRKRRVLEFCRWQRVDFAKQLLPGFFYTGEGNRKNACPCIAGSRDK